MLETQPAAGTGLKLALKQTLSLSESTNRLSVVPRFNFVSHRFTSHHIINLESRKENTRRKCGCGGDDDEEEDDDGTREQEARL